MDESAGSSMPFTSSVGEPTTTGGATGSTSGSESSGTLALTTEWPGSSSSESSSESSSTTSDETTGTTADDTTTGGSTSTGDDTTGSPIDCDGLPQGLLPYTIRPGPKASEDLAFDDVGNMIGVQNSSLFKSPYEGQPQLWIPNVGGFVAGLRMTSNGILVFSDSTSSTLFRVKPGNDFKEMVLSGLEYANGLEVDLVGNVYVAEQSGSRVRRINPENGEFTILADNLNNPNGVSFSPDYKTLYVGSFGGGSIHAINFKDNGVDVENVELLVGAIGGGGLDGMAVDACGNVYVCEYGPAIVWRISPIDKVPEQLINFGSDTSWIPNMQWGSGIGGWEKEILYVLDFSATRVFAVDVGIGDKPRAYP